MNDKTARLFSGLGVLVLVWIVVYWSWPLKDEGMLLGDVSLQETVESTPAESGSERAERFSQPLAEQVSPAPRTRPAPVVVEPEVEPEQRLAGGVIAPEFDPYVVRSGDNFERISQRVYGTRRFSMVIARSNPLLDPRKLREGQTIRVPKDPSNIQGIPVDEAGEAEDRPVPDESPTLEYTVRRGDTLSGIAKAFYGSVSSVDFLYEANRDRLSGKNDLRLGQVLLIPPLPQGAD